MDHAEIERRFRHHPPRNQGEIDEHELAREQFRQLAHYVVERVPAGREQALVLTHLEEGLMWANAGLARARADSPETTSLPEPPVAHRVGTRRTWTEGAAPPVQASDGPQITLSAELPGS